MAYDRFMSRVVKDPCGCWLWVGGVRKKTRSNNKEYGDFWLNGKRALAHRASWLLHKGDIPAGQIICHSCDTPLCVNPDHLWIGTQADNMKDAWSKGRGKNNSKQGERHKLSKLSERMVNDIKESALSGVELAKRFGVSPSTISMIRTGRNWRHLK